MTVQSTRSPYLRPVLLSLILVLVLALSLRIRLANQDPPPRPPRPTAPLHRLPAVPEARVPEPRDLDLAALPIPCWSCKEARGWPIVSRVDLDILAPLGDGSGNAGEWVAAYLVPQNPFHPEWSEASKRLIEGSGSFAGRLILAPDDPFLLAAEPWFDQERLQIYPELIPFEGAESRIPNFLGGLVLARSWIARGKAAQNADEALEDFRRVVRLGRLWRQEDVTVSADLVGIATIQLGAQAIYELAQVNGDQDLALRAAVVLGELTPQRFLTSDWVSRYQGVGTSLALGDGAKLTRSVFRQLLKVAETAPGRRFRLEALTQLAFVAHLGNRSQKERARRVIEGLEQDSDELIAAQATWAAQLSPLELKRLS